MFVFESIFLQHEFPDNFGREVDNLHSTDDWESSEQSHGASYCSVQNSATFPTLLLKSSKKVVFLSEISSK